MDARRGESLSSIIVAAPLSHWLLSLLAVILAVAIVLFLCLGHYTRRETVTGQVVPGAGLLNVSAPSAGTLASIHVRDGQVVRKGDLLLGLSSEAVGSVGRTDLVWVALRKQDRSERRKGLFHGCSDAWLGTSPANFRRAGTRV